MGGLDVRTFDAPDESLTDLEKVHAARVDADGVTAWRFVFEPGWRYTEHFEPQRCTSPHVGYIAAGRLWVEMEDGTGAEAGPGSVVVIGPGHDAWTLGDESCVLIDFGESVPR
jgi:quercetin dioxygenase-like cupin family protein